MTGGAEASHTNARLTSKEKGKGRPKRPATGNISHAGGGDGENDGDIVRITKRQATGRKSASGPTVPAVSTEGLPAGLVIIPPSPNSHSDDESAPFGVLRAQGSSVTTMRKLRKKKRPPLATGSETAATILGQLRIEQEKSEAAAFEKQAELDQLVEREALLDREVGYLSGQCREKNKELQEARATLEEVRAGRHLARGQAKIWEVKKEFAENEAVESSNMAEQLAAADERARLLGIESWEAIAQLAETAELKTKLEESLVRITELEAQLSGRSEEEGGVDVVMELEMEGERERIDRDTTHTPTTTQQAQDLEKSQAGQHDLQAKLDAAITERDAYRQSMLHEQQVLSGYKERLDQSELALRDLQAQAEVIVGGQDLDQPNATNAQTIPSDIRPHLPATDAALRTELRTAQRSLEFSRLSQMSAHRRYTEALQGMHTFVETYFKPTAVDQSEALESIASSSEDPLEWPYNRFTGQFGWTGKIMLESREAELKELCRRDSFHGYQSRSGPEADEISRFRSILGQRRSLSRVYHSARKCGGTWTLGDFIPSRSDKEAFPATWARWDQIFKDAKGSPTALLDREFIKSTRHGQWPEVSLVIYSWAFYKIHDSDWSYSKNSKRLLKALVDIWWHCGCNKDLFDTPEFRVYKRSTPIITGYPRVHCVGYMSNQDSDDSADGQIRAGTRRQQSKNRGSRRKV